MIDNPDGTKRLPTKEEILENVRSKSGRSIQPNGNASETTIGSDRDTPETYRRVTYTRPGTASDGSGTPQELTGRNRPIESNEGRRNSADGRVSGETREDGGWNSGTNEYHPRVTTYSATTSEKIKGSIKSRIDPYTTAIKESFQGRKKTSSTKQKPKAKVLSTEETIRLREKLKDTILWMSDQTDEIIIATTKGHLEIIIWSDIDHSDALKIADYLINRGKYHAQTADIVRKMVEIKEKIEVGMIILPRAYRTLQVYLTRGIGIKW